MSGTRTCIAVCIYQCTLAIVMCSNVFYQVVSCDSAYHEKKPVYVPGIETDQDTDNVTVDDIPHGVLDCRPLTQVIKCIRCKCEALMTVILQCFSLICMVAHSTGQPLH